MKKIVLFLFINMSYLSVYSMDDTDWVNNISLLVYNDVPVEMIDQPFNVEQLTNVCQITDSDDHQTSIKPFICEKCDCAYKHKRSLERHIAFAHLNKSKNPENKTFICSICQKGYKTTTGLLYHEKRAHEANAKIFQCDTCTKSFVTHYLLKHHKKVVHAHIKPFACDMCTYTTTVRVNLKRHQMSHKGIKPFVCDVCGYAFGEKGNLTQHEAIHVKERPSFPCDICGSSFSQKYNLTYHIKKKHR